jgi:hypothetical protein
MSAGPNLSRKNPGTVIYSFPTFDKCDSLLFFPATFARCVNSGDFTSLNKLIRSRIDRNCEITLVGTRVSLEGMLAVFELMNELRPDSIHCVHSTKVVENEIRATLCYKYTDNLTLRQALKGSFPDPRVYNACAGPRGDPEQRAEYVNSRPEHEQADIMYSLAFAEEVVVYGNAYLTLAFDEHTKKVTALKLGCDFTSFRVVQ